MDKFETDKYGSGLIEVYEDLFADMRDKPVKYLEVGIWKGGSMLWADEYFINPESVIVGIDKELPSFEYSGNKIDMHRCDQSDGAGLAAIAGNYGVFDIIIDDGCHFATETESTFNALWPFVRSGGIYVIEDFGAAYKHEHRQYYQGMPELMSKIMCAANDFGIKGFEIAHNLNRSASFGVFIKE